MKTLEITFAQVVETLPSACRTITLHIITYLLLKFEMTTLNVITSISVNPMKSLPPHQCHVILRIFCDVQSYLQIDRKLKIKKFIEV